MTTVPRISVVLPVYDAEPRLLRDALRSLLDQTFGDFEILLLDDGPGDPATDPSAQAIAGCTDPRVRTIRYGRRITLIDKLNEGVALARGEFVARMDADDISLPDRFALQVRYLDRHPDVDVVGTQFCDLDDPTRVCDHPTEPDDVRTELMTRGCVIGHPTVMMRRSVFPRFGVGYDARFAHAEDYGLWATLSMQTRLANLPEVLLHYRRHAGQVSVTKRAEQCAATARVRGMLAAQLLPAEAPAIVDLFERILAPDPLGATLREFRSRVHPWLRRLSAENRRRGLYPAARFDAFIRGLWLGQLSSAMKGMLPG